MRGLNLKVSSAGPSTRRLRLFSYLVKPFVSEVTVVDQSELTRANAKRFGLCYAPDVDSLDGCLSLIVAFHTLEHFVHPVRWLALARESPR